MCSGEGWIKGGVHNTRVQTLARASWDSSALNRQRQQAEELPRPTLDAIKRKTESSTGMTAKSVVSLFTFAPPKTRGEQLPAVASSNQAAELYYCT